MNDLFKENPTILFWKFEITMTTVSRTNGIATGKSSIIVQINELPKNGICKINSTTGVPSETVFAIECSNWVDNDGSIQKYVFSGKLFKIIPTIYNYHFCQNLNSCLFGRSSQNWFRN